MNKQQYGFTPQRGTEDALGDFFEHTRQKITEKKSVLVVSLDIEGAFDHAGWPALQKQLAIKECPKNLYKLVDAYFHGRKISVNYARRVSTIYMTKGCVQGFIGGPTFCNVI